MKISLFAIMGLLFWQCESPSNYIPLGLSRADKLKYDQYYLQGKNLYLTNCANCHQTEGQGFAKLYPPLAQRDYLMEDIARVACIIRYGQKGKITVKGVEYDMVMPGNQQLTNIEIAQLLTYITNSWGNEGSFIQVVETDRYLERCQSLN